MKLNRLSFCIWFFTCFFGLSGLIFGQEAPLLTLEQALNIALEENYGLRIADAQNEIAHNSATPGNAGMLPQVTLSGGYTQSITNTSLEFLNGPPLSQNGAGSNNANAALSLNQTLFDGFAMFNNLKRLRAQGDLSDLDQRIQVETTLFQVVSTYYELMRLQQNREVAEETVQISLERVERLRIRKDVGVGTGLQLLNAEVDLNTDSTNFLQADLAYENTARAMNTLLGRGPSTEFSVEESLGFPTMPGLDELISEAEKNNAQILRARQSRQIADLDAKLAQSSRYPRVGLNASYNVNRSTAEASFVTLNQTNGFTGGVTLTMNLYNGGRTNLQNQNAEIGQEISRLQEENARLSVRQELTAAHALYMNRRKIVQMEERNRETAQLNFERSTQQYALGQISSTDLRTAQLNLVQSKNRLSDAIFLAKVAETDLLRVAGIMLD